MVLSKPFYAAGGVLLDTACFKALKKQNGERFLNENSLPDLYYQIFAKTHFLQPPFPTPCEPVCDGWEQGIEAGKGKHLRVASPTEHRCRKRFLPARYICTLIRMTH